MSIPQNFNCVEQRIIAVDDDGTDTGASFSVAPPAGVSTTDCLVMNTGSKGCQLLFAPTLALAEAVGKDAAAPGTVQYKIPAGAIMTVWKGANKFAGAVCESGENTTLYLHSGQGS
jgi:hypothetical protein